MKPSPWWHKSLLWAVLLWVLTAGWLLIVPTPWSKGATVGLAVAWFAFLAYLWLKNDDPSPPSDDAAPDPERWHAP